MLVCKKYNLLKIWVHGPRSVFTISKTYQDVCLRISTITTKINIFIKRLGNRASLVSVFIWENACPGNRDLMFFKWGLVQSYTLHSDMSLIRLVLTMQTQLSYKILHVWTSLFNSFSEFFLLISLKINTY